MCTPSVLARFPSVLQPEGDDGGTTSGLELYCSMRETAAAAAHPHGHTLSVPKDTPCPCRDAACERVFSSPPGCVLGLLVTAGEGITAVRIAIASWCLI